MIVIYNIYNKKKHNHNVWKLLYNKEINIDEDSAAKLIIIIIITVPCNITLWHEEKINVQLYIYYIIIYKLSTNYDTIATKTISELQYYVSNTITNKYII